jgi:hypothetical protein
MRLGMAKIEVRYQEGDANEYHLYLDGEYYLQLNKNDIIKALEEYYIKALEKYYNDEENR